MKKTLKLISLALLAGAMCACGSDDKNDSGNSGTDPKPEKKDYPPITLELVTTNVEGDTTKAKAGYAGAIEVSGEGFDADFDDLYFGWEENGETVYSDTPLSDNLSEVRSKHVSVGIHVADPLVGKTVKLYLDRIGYDRMPLTDNIQILLPEVSEGYIPDPAFRATLMSDHEQQGNKDIAKMFNAYGLLPPAMAATVETINLYNSSATSLEGIELFTNANRLIAHETQTLEKADFSKWKSSRCIFITMERSVALKEIIGGPSIGRLDCYDCKNLTKVDLHHCRWTYNLQLFDSDKGVSYVTEFDMRRDRTGNFKGGPDEGAEGYTYCSEEDDYTVFLAGAWMRLADNAHIMVDYQFLVDKWGTTEEGAGYACIYSAWKRGATIDVYSSKNIEKKLGTVPMFSDDPDALTLTGANGWVPAETE